MYIYPAKITTRSNSKWSTGRQLFTLKCLISGNPCQKAVGEPSIEQNVRFQRGIHSETNQLFIFILTDWRSLNKYEG